MEEPLIHDPFAVLSVLILIPATFFWLAENKRVKGIFRFVPILAFCYLVPSILNTFHIIPKRSVIYAMIKGHMLAPCLILLTLSVDLKAIFRLGPQALLLFFAGTVGVFVGGVVAYATFRADLPEEIWRGLAALCGSWIGAGINFVSVTESLGVSDSIIGMMTIVDLIVASSWLTILLLISGKSHEIYEYNGSNTQAIKELQQKMQDYQKKTSRLTTTKDIMLIFMLAFAGAQLGIWPSQHLPTFGKIITSGTWKILCVTIVGLVLSQTPARKLEGAGASKFGTFFLYLLIGSIGAGTDFYEITQYPVVILLGCLWMFIHGIIILMMMLLTRSPIFFAAVGSQANIGGLVSAPIVASAFHPSLASVGVLLGVLGQLIGTYVALLFAKVLSLWSTFFPL